MVITAVDRDAGTRATAASARRGLVVAAAGLGAVAVVLAASGSWIPSLWGDEATSVMSASRPLVSLFGMLTRVDAVHGLYYVVLHGWIEVFGPSPFSVRLPSAIGVGVCTAAVVWLCGRVAGLPTAVGAGALAAVLPRLTYAGEEARSYAFDAAIAAVLCAVVIEILLRRPEGRRWWVAYAGLLALGTYSFLYLGLMALPAGIAVAAHRPSRHLRRWLVSTAIGLGCAVPVFALGALQRSQISYLTRADAVNPASVFVQMWFGRPSFATLGWVLIGVAVLGFVIDVLRGRRAVGARWADAVRLEPIVIAWLVVPMGVLIAVSPLLADFTSRYGTLAAPAAAILMALGVRRIARAVRAPFASWTAAGVLAVAVLVTVAPVWASQRTPYAKNGSDWNEIAAVISHDARPSDAIVFDAAAHPSRRPRLAMDTDPSAFRWVDDVLLKTPYAQAPWWWDETYTVGQGATLGRFIGIERVWLVEYTGGGTVDTWGLQPLQKLGFQVRGRIVEHSSRILLLTRPHTHAHTDVTR